MLQYKHRIFLMILGLFVILCTILIVLFRKELFASNRNNHSDYILALSWSPSYCLIARNAAKTRQCSPNKENFMTTGFIVHGLWPQASKLKSIPPAFCHGKEYKQKAFPKHIAEQMLDIMPSIPLMKYQWHKHGSCTNMDISAYFTYLRQLWNTVNIPLIFKQPQSYQFLTVASIKQTFKNHNPQIPIDSILPICRNNLLREVRFCVNKKLSFIPCPVTQHKRQCQSEPIIVPPTISGENIP